MERPSELTYALDERPPWTHLIGLGFQHVAVICPYLVMVALVAQAAKLPHEAALSAVGLAMIAVALMTILQSLRLGPVGSGYLCPPVVSAIYLPSSLAVASSFGIAAVCGMTIFAGFCETVVASLINWTRKLFPAVVSGVVIIAVGLELGKISASILFAHTAEFGDQVFGVLYNCGHRAHHHDRPCDLGDGAVEAVLRADRHAGWIRRRRALPHFSLQFLCRLRSCSGFRDSRPELSFLHFRAVVRRAFRDCGPRFRPQGDRRVDDLSTDERRVVEAPGHAQHRGRSSRRRARVLDRGTLWEAPE